MMMPPKTVIPRKRPKRLPLYIKFHLSQRPQTAIAGSGEKIEPQTARLLRASAPAEAVDRFLFMSSHGRRLAPRTASVLTGATSYSRKIDGGTD
ncbi:hypothetical protein HPB50_004210 [Hyalomma asiaticum]|uniref:Uncharacterized protein n=1 Tax=Hyalomma asiaticum TaxID=266040 RepID=A0ACB7SYV4_HYAAI|nr:hypothetical protein HPB50_004210 [Hyalomma asiaticum]